MCWKEEEERVGRKNDVNGEFQWCLGMVPGEDDPSGQYRLLPPPAPCGEFIAWGPIAERVLSKGPGRLDLLSHLFHFDKPTSCLTQVGAHPFLSRSAEDASWFLAVSTL